MQSGISALVQSEGGLEEVPSQLQRALRSGLFPLPRLSLPPSQVPPPGGTFQWLRCPCDEDGLPQLASGTVYTDGSRIANDHPDTLRLG